MSSGIVMGKRIVGRPRIVTVGPSGVEAGQGGLHCCCCSCCTCINLQFLRTSEGRLKLSEVETLFNAVAAFLYLSSSSYLSYGVNVFLRPLYVVTPFFQVYPAMTAAYILGLVLGVIHGYDAYLAYRQFRGST